MDYAIEKGKRIEMFKNRDGRGFYDHLYDNLC
jgi:hypothetical protein